MGNENPEASVLGEISFDQEGACSEVEKPPQQLVIPARISQELSYKIREIAVRAFQVMECAGMASVDFFITSTGEVYLNQINTVPGFSEISIYPSLWQAVDVSPAQLLERLIELALERAESNY